jgi:hypothetical protein
MSVDEILAELPKLTEQELETVLELGVRLHDKLKFVASPELLQAIAEADADPEDQDVAIEEMEQIVKAWPTK